MTSPYWAVSRSGYGGRGYVLPALDPDIPSKRVKLANGDYAQARVGADGNAILLPSVTTVLKQTPLGGIVQWAVDQTAAYAVANIDDLLRRTEEQGYGFLRWYHTRDPLKIEQEINVRNYHQGVLDDAAELGTLMHEYIQAEVDPSCQYPDTSTAPDYFWQMVEVWDAWYSENFIEPLFTECTVYDAWTGWAGTFDYLWRINGRLTLGDIKTSRALRSQHSMQLSALSYAERILYKVGDEWKDESFDDVLKDTEGIDDYNFMHIRPTDVDSSGNEIPAYIETVDLKHRFNYYEQFMGYLRAEQQELIIHKMDLEEAKK